MHAYIPTQVDCLASQPACIQKYTAPRSIAMLQDGIEKHIH